ncbi:hypothetical protein [Deinococcus sp. QL22]|uniref:hypothetical protein n=1 Tax=Deinococcus sp. QL22 TaxID=2939437 RepID=UPI002017608C|nr:hypothetical protein [Deinococcus sp. QL22]UQN10341.1 hypothetical protein M1R55_29765 [Deinococcus sp. QL22]UQN10475.1 hypothetical protein M1R55_29090 [Deinococcus sp. QL22]
MAKLSLDSTGLTQHPRENLSVAGMLAALNAVLDCRSDGCATVSLDVRGTFSLTLQVQGTVDGVTWVPLPMRSLTSAASNSAVLSITGSTAGLWTGSCAGYTQLRVTCTTYTSGSAVVTLAASLGYMDDYSRNGSVTPLLGTAVGAAGAALTLTLAAPGTGLRHYLTYLAINRFAAAALTAAAVPVTVTTTNLPGPLAFSFGAEAAAQGTLDRWREDFAAPLVSSAQNTATTIVCPVTTGVIWRVTAGYYVAP